MINTSLDLVPPIRGLESFSSSVFYCSGGWMMVFSLEIASIFFYLVLKKSCHHDRFGRSYDDF